MNIDAATAALGTRLAIKGRNLRPACEGDLAGKNSPVPGKSLPLKFAADRIAALTTDTLDKMDLVSMTLDALAAYRSVRDAARSTREQPGSVKNVVLASPKVSAPQRSFSASSSVSGRPRGLPP